MRDLQSIENFCVRYGGGTAEDYARIDADLLIVEGSYFKETAYAGAFTADEIAAMRRGPRGERLVIGYLSLGSIDRGRPRFARDGFERIVGGDIAGSEVSLRYWEAAARDCLGAWLDELAREQRFDGAYLDVVDAYWRLKAQFREATAGAMMRLVVDLVARVRARTPAFKVVLGHAPSIIADHVWSDGVVGGDKALITTFRRAIDAFVIETSAGAGATGVDLANASGTLAGWLLHDVLGDARFDLAPARALAIGYAGGGDMAAYARLLARLNFLPYVAPGTAADERFAQTHYIWPRDSAAQRR